MTTTSDPKLGNRLLAVLTVVQSIQHSLTAARVHQEAEQLSGWIFVAEQSGVIWRRYKSLDWWFARSSAAKAIGRDRNNKVGSNRSRMVGGAFRFVEPPSADWGGPSAMTI